MSTSKKNGSCRFCKINPDRNKIVKRFNHCYVLLSNPRIVEGQVLIIPNRHVERISQLKDDELLEMMRVLNEYCDRILKFADGYMIKNNYMPFLEESERKVNHLHIHIIPRYYHDELYTKAMIHEDKLFKALTDKEYDKFMKRIGA
ncbi:MAG: HIT family protein [Candidatus Woesearchaeota archaeon]